jgi:hypothetical protein
MDDQKTIRDGSQHFIQRQTFWKFSYSHISRFRERVGEQENAGQDWGADQEQAAEEGLSLC